MTYPDQEVTHLPDANIGIAGDHCVVGEDRTRHVA